MRDEVTVMDNMHDGHRERMREKVEKFGFKCFADHELLEMLLFYVNSRGNTNHIAHELIATFGGLADAIEASRDELKSVKGMGDKGAMLFELITECIKRMKNSVKSTKTLANSVDCANYIIPLFHGVKTEQLHIFCMDIRYRVCEHRVVSTGWVDGAAVNKREMIKVAINSNAYRTVIAHNHPGGDAKPSIDDINVTKELMATFMDIGIPMVDHIIVGENGYYSFAAGQMMQAGQVRTHSAVAQYSRER